MTTARKILIYGLYAVIVIGLGVAIVLALTRDSGNKVAKSKAPTSSQKTTKQAPQQATDTPQANPQQPQTTANTQAAGDAARTALGDKTVPQKPNKTDQLANTGPGSSLALFTTTVLLASVAFHYRQLKNVNRA